jgi:exosortase
MSHYLIWILFIAIYVPTFVKLYRTRWDLLDYTHAYFILPVSLWLVWRHRKQIKKYIQTIEPKMNYGGFFFLLMGILIFILGSRFQYIFLMTLSLIPILVGFIYLLYGTAMVRLLTFPILYLLLLVPPPMGIIDNITLPMRYGISNLTEHILQILNYPITREGLLLTIGYNDIFMGQPCSGFRSLITLLSLGIVYVYISKGNVIKKFILTFSIVPIALFGNLIRVITLCLITFYFGEEAGQGFFHNFSGIVMFIITILGLISLEALLNRKRVSA